MPHPERPWLESACVLAQVLVFGAALGCGDEQAPPEEGLEFTRLAGNRVLAELSPEEADQLCADLQAFSSQAMYRADDCRFEGVTNALRASENPDVTDDELRELCANAGCPSGGFPDAGAAGTCDPLPSDCSATVAESGACFVDGLTQSHQIAVALPDCTALTRENILERVSAAYAQAIIPESCQTVRRKCPGLSPAD